MALDRFSGAAARDHVEYHNRARIKDSRISISGLPERQAIEHQAINVSSYGVQSGSVYLFVYYVTRMALDPAFHFFVNPARIMYADYQ